MINVTKRNLGEVTEARVDQSGPKGREFTYVDIGSIELDTKRIVEPKVLPVLKAPSRARQILKIGDVLVSMTRPNRNAVALVPRELDGAIGSTGFHVLRAQNVEPGFLFYAVQTNEFIDELCEKVQGALYPAVRPRDIASFKTYLPASLAEQRRIVAEIDKQFTRLEAGVAALRRVQANLERYRAAVLKAACEGRLVPTEAGLAETEKRKPKLETGEALLVRILTDRRKNWRGRGQYKEPSAPDTSKFSPLPEGWTWASVEQLLREPLCNGLSVKGSDDPPGVRALRLSAMSNSGFDYSDARYLPVADADVDDLWIQEGDFFMSRGNGSLHLVGRGTSAQNPPQKTIFPDTMIRLRLTDTLRMSGWVRTLWQSRLVRSQIEAKVKTTAGIYKIAQPQVAGMVIPLPPLVEQARIVAEVERRLSVIEELEATVYTNLQRASRLRQSILQRAFSPHLTENRDA